MSDVIDYPTETSSFASVANIIGDPRLAGPLAQLKREVRIEFHNIAKPTEVKRDIERLRRDARRFEIALSRVSKRLLDLPMDAGQHLKKAKEALHDITELCNESLRTISTKPGAPRKPGRVTCALIVIEALALVKGKAPSANSPTAQSACEEYWRCCGGKAGDPAIWRQTIRIALADQSAWRRHIRDEIWQGTE